MRVNLLFGVLLVVLGAVGPAAVADDGSPAGGVEPVDRSFVPDDVSDIYQSDGDSGQDAPDTCKGTAKSDVRLSTEEVDSHGELLPGDQTVEALTTVGDLEDFWGAELGTTSSGAVTVETNTPFELDGTLDYRITVTVLDPDCQILAVTSLDTTDETVLEFPIEQDGLYRVGLEIQRASDGDASSQQIVIPTAGHCSPYCFGYELQLAR